MIPRAPRSERITAFVAHHGWSAATQVPIAQDASKRNYHRLIDGQSHAILMDTPPEAAESTRSFEQIATYLRGIGLGAPQVYACDHDLGVMIIQDLGTLRFADEFRTAPKLQPERYGAAIDALAHLTRSQPCADLPRMGADRYMTLLDRLFDFYCCDPLSDSQKTEFLGHLSHHAQPVFDTNFCTTLRDCHAENLIWTPDSTGLARVGMIDFQDAVLSHPCYDVVSLLYDVRRDIDPALRDQMLDRFRHHLGHDADQFSHGCAMLSLLRNLRILGGFARLAAQDGKHHYLDWAPRTWDFVMQALAHPQLAGLQDVIISTIPAPTPNHRNRIISQC